MATTPTPDAAKRLELSVSNFGPIAEGRVELRPLTVFVGPSNTGKSYLATLIYALHRFFNSHYGLEKSRYLPGGAFLAQYTLHPLPRPANLSTRDIETILKWTTDGYRVWGKDESEYRRFRDSELPASLSTLVRKALRDVARWNEALSNEIARCFGLGHLRDLVRYSAIDQSCLVIRDSVSDTSRECSLFEYHATLNEETKISATVSDDLPIAASQLFPPHYSPPVHILLGMESASYEEKANLASELLAAFFNAVVSGNVGALARPAHYLLTSRANLMHTHQAIAQSLIAGASRAATQPHTSPTFSGLLGDFLGQVVGLGDQNNQRKEADYLLALDLERKVIRGAIHIASNPVGYPEFLYRPYGWARDIPLANTSSMVSELAPVVLYLRHVVQPGDTLIIEEPESHLHPAMQVEFTRLLAAAVKAGIRIIITTHSEWILEELANLLLMSELPVEHREGFEGADLALAPDEVGAWLFEPNAEASGTVIKEMPLDKEMGNFDSGFGLITTDLYNRYARISNRIERLKEG